MVFDPPHGLRRCPDPNGLLNKPYLLINHVIIIALSNLLHNGYVGVGQRNPLVLKVQALQGLLFIYLFFRS